MVLAGILMGYVRKAMKQAWMPAMAGLSLAAVSLTGQAFADSDNVKRITYTYDQNNVFHESYDAAIKAMQPIIAGTQYAKDNSFKINLMIGLAGADLNNDKIPEIIAFPVESDGDEPGVLCSGKNYLCPHYVLDVAGDKPHTLAIIFADSVDQGDDIKNGYWTLKAFKKEREAEGKNDFEIYAYDPKTKSYLPETIEAKPDPK